MPGLPRKRWHATREAARRLRRRTGAPSRRPRARAQGLPRLRAPSGTPGLRRHRAALAFTAVTLAGAWLGLLGVASLPTTSRVGPVDTQMTLSPSLHGGTTIDIAPLGALQLNSHRAPLGFTVDVERLDQERAEALIDHPERLEGLEEEIVAGVRAGARDAAVRTALGVATGAGALGLVVYRRPRRALAAGGLSLLLLAVSGGTAYATWNPTSVLEPRYSGLLASAPSVVGNARSIATEFDVYQKELARLVTNVAKLYETASTLPAYRPDPSTTRVLHLSDVHLNPAAWHIVGSLVEQYEIDVIIDTGDTMDHGTPAENGFLAPVADLGAPYVWVRGNHDSQSTQHAVRKLGRHVHVLDKGRALDIAGLRLAGWGDPQFTPDRSVEAAGDHAEAAAGRRLAAALRAQRAAGTPVDIALGHTPELVRQTDGLVPLALAGHTHERSNEVLRHGTRLMIEGSTGGGGLRAVEGDAPQQVQASVL